MTDVSTMIALSLAAMAMIDAMIALYFTRQSRPYLENGIQTVATVLNVEYVTNSHASAKISFESNLGRKIESVVTISPTSARDSAVTVIYNKENPQDVVSEWLLKSKRIAAGALWFICCVFFALAAMFATGVLSLQG